MARGPRTGGAASSTNTPSTPIPSTTPAGTPAGSATSTPVASTRASRRGTASAAGTGATTGTVAAVGGIAGPLASGAFTTAPSTPSPLAEEVGASTPDSTGGAGCSTTKTPGRIERKAHALRSVGGAANLVTSPFPEQYGGREKCGVNEEDEADEVLMAVCGACSVLNNRALALEDIARIAFDNGWLRPPSAAVEPTSPFGVAIRNHIKRCEKAEPPRAPLVASFRLTGAAAEQSLQPALHPNAFDGPNRPKGFVYYLATVGKQKWKNPFDGLDLSKPPPKKVQPKKIAAAPARGISPAASASISTPRGRPKKETKSKGKARSSTPAQVPPASVASSNVKEEGSKAGDAHHPKIRLSFSGAGLSPEESKHQGRPAVPVDIKPDIRSIPTIDSRSPSPPSDGGIKTAPKGRRPSRLYDSSDESDTSSEEDVPGPSTSCSSRLRLPRKAPPPPINTASTIFSGSPRFSALMRLPSQGSPFRDLFFSPSSCATSAFPLLANAGQPAAPAHSLDNEYWAARPPAKEHEVSDCSSEDELAEQDWGQTSEIVIRTGEDMDMDDKDGELYGLTEDEIKIKEATEALRALFPTKGQEDDDMSGSREDMSLLRPESAQSPGLTPILNDAAITARLAAFRACTSPTVALTAAPATSSPLSSPQLEPLPPTTDAPPALTLSPAPSPFEIVSDGMEDDRMWLDGELPVRADPEDAFSDTEVLSAAGDATPDRRLDTAVWAQETAVSAPYVEGDKDIADYPSPMLTEGGSEGSDLTSLGEGEGEADVDADADISRSSSADALSPSSRSSEIEPCDLSQEYDYDDLICGPESMTQAEIDEDEWIQEKIRAKTPKKLPRCKSKTGAFGMTMIGQPQGCHRMWGSIGVGTPAEPHLSITPARALRSNKMLAPASPRSPRSPRPGLTSRPSAPSAKPDADGDVDMDPADNVDVAELDEAIGTADLELAHKEAEEQEAAVRATIREKAAAAAAHKTAICDLYRQMAMDFSSPSTPFDASEVDFASLGFGSGYVSAESLVLATPDQSALPTPGVTSGMALSPITLSGLSALTLAELASPMHACVDPKALSTANTGPNALLPPLPPNFVQMPEDDDMMGLGCNGDGVPCINGMSALSLPTPGPAHPPSSSPTPIPSSNLATAPTVQVGSSSGDTLGAKSARPTSSAGAVSTSQASLTPNSGSNIKLEPTASAPATPAAPAQIPPAFVNGLNLGRPIAPLIVPPPNAVGAAASILTATTPSAGAPPAAAAPKKGTRKPAAAKAKSTPASRQNTPATRAPATAVPTASQVAASASAPPSGLSPMPPSGEAARPVSIPSSQQAPSQTAQSLIAAPASTAPGPQTALKQAVRTAVPPPVPGAPAATVPVRPPAPNQENIASCAIRRNISATVFANVPVFQYHAMINDKPVMVYRRLDSDWVNMTNFLLASGMAPAKCTQTLKQDLPCLKQRQILTEHAYGSDKGLIEVPRGQMNPPGATGMWLPLRAARQVAELHGIDMESDLAALLDWDLFEIFRRVAKFTGDRGMSGFFGQMFHLHPDPAFPQINGGKVPESNLARTPSPPNRPLTAGSAPSAGGPNRPTSALAGAAQVSGQAPLIRPATGLPDGCPQPKRRRATVVGQAGAKPILPLPNGVTPRVAPVAGPGGVPVRPGMTRPGVNTPASASAPTSPKGALPLHPHLANTVGAAKSISPTAIAAAAQQAQRAQGPHAPGAVGTQAGAGAVRPPVVQPARPQPVNSQRKPVPAVNVPVHQYTAHLQTGNNRPVRPAPARTAQLGAGGAKGPAVATRPPPVRPAASVNTAAQPQAAKQVAAPTMASATPAAPVAPSPAATPAIRMQTRASISTDAPVVAK